MVNFFFFILPEYYVNTMFQTVKYNTINSRQKIYNQHLYKYTFVCQMHNLPSLLKDSFFSCFDLEI